MSKMERIQKQFESCLGKAPVINRPKLGSTPSLRTGIQKELSR